MADSADKKTVTVSDRCPMWASDIFMQIRQLEVHLGNIPAADKWQGADDLEELQERLFGEGAADLRADEETVERLFIKACANLDDEGFTAEEIAGFANARIGYKNGPPYCNAAEVDEAIASVGSRGNKA